MKKQTEKPYKGEYTLVVKKSLTGKGLFAGEEIPKGKRLIEYFGTDVPNALQYTSRSKYLFEISKNKMVNGNIPENTARYINHSCRPNCEVDVIKRRIYISSRRKIQEGEELSYDYGKEYFDQHLKPNGCKCVKCREK